MLFNPSKKHSGHPASASLVRPCFRSRRDRHRHRHRSSKRISRLIVIDRFVPRRLYFHGPGLMLKAAVKPPRVVPLALTFASSLPLGSMASSSLANSRRSDGAAQSAEGHRISIVTPERYATRLVVKLPFLEQPALLRRSFLNHANWRLLALESKRPATIAEYWIVRDVVMPASHTTWPLITHY